VRHAARPSIAVTSHWIPLPAAARRLGLSWAAVIALVKTGRLEGRLCAGQRWFIRSDSIAKWQRAA